VRGLLVASACGHVDGAHADEPNRATEVTPPEDLMREQRVLNRVLLVYEAGIQKFARGEDFEVAILFRAANIVREFIEGITRETRNSSCFPVSARPAK
jgi:hypothetical protein